MQCLESDDLLQFNPNTLQEVRKLYGFENVSDLNRAIDVLEQWVKQQNHFGKKDFRREFYEKLLITSKGSIEKAKKRLDKYCTVRTLMPQFFKEYDFENEFQDLKGLVWHCLIPKPTKDNYRIFWVRTEGQKFKDNLCIDYFRAGLLFAEYALNNDYPYGFILVVDYRNANVIEIASKLNVLIMQQAMSILIDAYGMRVIGMHVISSSKAIDLIISLLKQVVSAKIASRIHVHKSIDSLTEYVPKELWPENYGGNQKSLEKLHEAFQDRFKSQKEVEARRETAKAMTNESLRQIDKFNEDYMGMPGSFRTLTVD